MCQAATVATIVGECKRFIEANNVSGLQAYYTSLQDMEFPCAPDWAAIFQRVYLHACLRKRREIVTLLEQLYQGMDPVQKIVLRHVFPYGRALLAR